MKEQKMKNVLHLLTALPVLFSLTFAPPAQAEPHAHEENTAAESHDDHDDHAHDEKSTAHDHAADGRAAEEGEEGEDAHGHEENDALNIAPEAEAEMGIQTSTAGAGVIANTIAVTGRVVLNKNAIAEVQGRFQGIVKSVTRTEGETVTAGETLATVESNESLQVYPVKSPIGGIILERNTNIGHITNDEAMFVIADMSKLWVEFNVFSKDAAHVAAGQDIRISPAHGTRSVDTVLTALLPVADSASQTVIARAVVDNGDGTWRPGMAVRGDIVTARTAAVLTVQKTAVQRIEGKPVVFVKKDGKFEQREVTLGRADNENVEVLSGIAQGEIYVSAGSFVLKAHAGKAGAEHAH